VSATDFGIDVAPSNINATDFKKMYDGGFRWVRLDFVWKDTEKTAGEYSFSRYVEIMQLLKAQGLRPYFILDYGNPLYDGGSGPVSKEGRDAYVRWAMAAISKFGWEDVVWEIWNEPNLDRHWGGPVNVAAYSALTQQLIESAHKSISPDIRFIVGAVSEDDRVFISQYLKLNFSTAYSYFSTHPYRSGYPDSVLSDFRDFRGWMADGAKLILGEWGYPSLTDPHGDARQAITVTRMFSLGKACNIPMVVWYKFQDDKDLGVLGRIAFGLLRSDGSIKPSWNASAFFLHQLGDSTVVGAYLDHKQAVRVIAFKQANGRSVLLGWADRNGTRLTLPFSGKSLTSYDVEGTAISTQPTFSSLDMTLDISPKYFYFLGDIPATIFNPQALCAPND
jgi:hypothetical protein